MKVMICGGTGFIGFKVIELLLEKGHEASSISIDDCEMGDWFPRENVSNEYLDLFKADENSLIERFKGFDALVYAVGPDDRFVPDKPSYSFFKERLVDACEQVIVAARKAGIKRCAICNSYFAYFDRARPELKLKEKHPYIRCRVEQAETCISAGGKDLDVMIMELPYIFGVHPVRMPIWKDVVIDRLKKMKPYIYFFKGGSTMITVQSVAQAIVGALEHGKGGTRCPIGDENHDWIWWLKIMLDEMGIERKIKIMPTWFGTLFGKYMMWKESRHGKESGLNYGHLFKDIQTQEYYIDSEPIKKELGYSGGGVEESLRKTVKKCL